MLFNVPFEGAWSSHFIFLRLHLLLETMILCCVIVLWMEEEDNETHIMVPGIELALIEFQKQ